MNKVKIFISVFLVWVAQISCYAPRRSVSATNPLSVEVEFPSYTVRGEKYQFIIYTSPSVICHAGVAFWDTTDQWVFDEFPTIQANTLGICEWSWEVPIRARNGVAAFRGFVENANQSTDLMPQTFCIEIENCE